MEKLRKIYNRPKIDWVSGEPKCFCNECEGEICRVKFDISLGGFRTIFHQELPLLCRKCLSKKSPIVNPLISLG